MAVGEDRDRSPDRPPECPVVPHHVGMLIYPDAQILDIAGPLEVFSRAARWLSETWGYRVPAYEVSLVAARPGPVRTSGGLSLVAETGLVDAGRMDTLLVTGGIGFETVCTEPALLEWICTRAGDVARVGSICTGAMILAAAGLLNGREATTHWAYLDRLAAMAPDCRVRGDALYVESGPVFTSAGVTAGIDLALALVERDWGRMTAVAVARQLVVYRRRTADQAQISAYLDAEQRDDRFGELQLWILDHLSERLDVERLAARVAMSPRHFSRQFKTRTGTTPADYIARLRVEEACRRIEAKIGSLKDIARLCGFGDEQTMRRAFVRQIGLPPAAYRPAGRSDTASLPGEVGDRTEQQ